MPRGRSTFTKRQKEQTRQQKQRDKAERRVQRKEDKPEGVLSMRCRNCASLPRRRRRCSASVLRTKVNRSIRLSRAPRSGDSIP